MFLVLSIIVLLSVGTKWEDKNWDPIYYCPCEPHTNLRKHFKKKYGLEGFPLMSRSMFIQKRMRAQRIYDAWKEDQLWFQSHPFELQEKLF